MSNLIFTEKVAPSAPAATKHDVYIDSTTKKLASKDSAGNVVDYGDGGDMTTALTHAATSKTPPIDADELPLLDSVTSFSLKKLTWANLKATIKAYTDTLYNAIVTPGTAGNVMTSTGSAWSSAALPVREKLSANRTYYVRTDGNDSNTGLADTSGGAFLTIQKAVSVVSSLDFGIYDATIQIADGTYSENVTFKNIVGGGTLYIKGNLTTPTNVIIAGTGGSTLFLKLIRGTFDFSGFKITNSGGIGIYAYGAGVILFLDKINFGACSNVHAVSSSGAFIKTTTVNISGASSYHIYCETWGNYEWYGGSSTTTITGTPAFNQFVYCGDTGRVVVYGITFSGSATGVRYYAALNSVINTFGSGASYLPGNSAGSVATGGQYV